jgi:hypothetical protein
MIYGQPFQEDLSRFSALRFPKDSPLPKAFRTAGMEAVKIFNCRRNNEVEWIERQAFKKKGGSIWINHRETGSGTF